MNMECTEIKMGQLAQQWRNGDAKSITFCVTEDCNLACKYCYMTGKNKRNKMNFTTAKRAIDYILSNRQIFNDEAVVWEFIGGEPFLEIDLIDQICDYIKFQMYRLDHPWFSAYMFNFSSNGVLYDTLKVQNYIKKNKGHLSIGISIDGNKIKHDLQRVKPDGTGSYDDVVKNVPLWQKQFPGNSTKATFAHEDLPFLKDSIISLWNLGIKIVSANVVFEDVWTDGDDIIFENQLKELADYILENKLWSEYSVRFFDPSIGFPVGDEQLKRNYCGTGRMLAIDCKGNFYPCIRFYDISLNNRKGITIGDINNGINFDKLRPFELLTFETASGDKCLNCEVATGCAWCTGCNYDTAETDTIFNRATFICNMHKANVRANNYFWDKFNKTTGLHSVHDDYIEANKLKMKVKFLYFITSDNIKPHCSYRNFRNSNNIMSKEIFNEGIKFAGVNGFIPVVLGYGDNINEQFLSNYIYIGSNEDTGNLNEAVAILDNSATEVHNVSSNIILLINKDNIIKLSQLVQEVYRSSNRINLVLEDIDTWKDDDISSYKEQLNKLMQFVLYTYKTGNPIEVNVLTDILNLTAMCNCDAGINSFSLAPNGEFYICPAYYFDNPENSVGNLIKGIEIKNSHLLELEHSPACSSCDAYHCKRCTYLNKKTTNELSIPSKIQCIISHIERNKARELQILLKEKGYTFKNIISDINYLDPVQRIKSERRSVGHD